VSETERRGDGHPGAPPTGGGSGSLVLVATPIGNLGDLSARALDVLRGADVIAAEDTRRTRALLSHAAIRAGQRLRAVHGHNERASADWIVDAVRDGSCVAYVTDAGTPGISDPGERLVRACLDADLVVDVVPGPSAVLTALVLSGFATDRFVFEGFLPRRGSERRERVAALVSEGRTVVLYESPRRLHATLTQLLGACGPLREVAIARELTKLHQEVWRGTLDAAVGHAELVEPRGEHVIVLGPALPAPEASDEEIGAHVAAAFAEGLSTRDAAARVARDLGVARRRAYDAAMRLKSKHP
jgi:16S rRNA (cytidine1402-2'-O)-methyltransferase